MTKRKYLPTLAELIDRLSISQLKEVFIPEHKTEYAQEIADITHDIELCLKEGTTIDAKTIRAIVVLAQFNAHIWVNESNYRKGGEGSKLELTHALNGVRNRAKNVVQEIVGGRKDYKTDCLAAEYSDWEPSWEVDHEGLQRKMTQLTQNRGRDSETSWSTIDAANSVKFKCLNCSWKGCPPEVENKTDVCCPKCEARVEEIWRK